MALYLEDYLDVSVDCVVFGFDDNQLKVLLIEKSRLMSEQKLQKALPGNLVFRTEALLDAAKRVLKELTGLNGVYLKQFQTFGDPDRVKGVKDQQWLRRFRKKPDAQVITVAYYSLVNMEEYHLSPSSFAENAEWVDIDSVPELAFDHNEILDKALEQLQRDTLFNNISFELLPTKFTLGQLQHLYEIILGKSLDKRNFRKSIRRIESLIPLDEKQTNVDHKPAQLFMFRKHS